MTHRTKGDVGRRVMDFALYVAIGILLVGAMILWVFLFPNLPVRRQWFAFVVFTAVTVNIFVQGYWHVRASTALWQLLGLWLAIHTCAYVVLLKRVPTWPTLAYAVTMPAEVMAVACVIWLVLRVVPKFPGRSDGEVA